MADPKGEFTVAELDGVVAALAKLTWLDEGQWWMEGLRVDPERRLKGIGLAITRYQIELAKRLGGGVVRYMTGLRNDGSHRIAERVGFHVLARFVERVVDKLDGPVEAETLTSADLDAVWEMMHDSDLLRAANGLYFCNWKAYTLTREWLAEHLGKSQVMGVRDETGRVCAWCLLQVESDWERLGLNTLDGSTEGIITLAGAMRAQAAAMGKVMVEKVDGEGFIVADIDPDYAKKVRAEVGFFQDE